MAVGVYAGIRVAVALEGGYTGVTENTFFTNYPPYENFRNTIDNTVTVLMEYLAERYMMGIMDRVIISSTELALRRRAGRNAWSNANLPFVNVSTPSVEKTVNRSWYNHILAVGGVHVPELSRKVKMLPIRLRFDSNLFYHNVYDVQFAMFRAIQDEHFEDRLSIPVYSEGGIEVPIIGILEYSLDTRSQFSDTEFLEKNRIRTIQLNPYIDTYILWDVPVYPTRKTILRLRQSGLDATVVEDTLDG